MKGILMRTTCHGYSIPIYWRLRIVRNKIDTSCCILCIVIGLTLIKPKILKLFRILNKRDVVFFNLKEIMEFMQYETIIKIENTFKWLLIFI